MNAFSKAERLCSKKLIDQLFEKGTSFTAYPFRVVYLQTLIPTDYPVQALFSVSRKKLKRAVDRNRVKRLMREAYRLHKQGLYDHLRVRQVQLTIAFIYTGKEILSFEDIKRKIILILHRLEKNHEEGG